MSLRQSMAGLHTWGGLLPSRYAVVEMPGGIDQVRWVTDPFAFLQAALFALDQGLAPVGDEAAADEAVHVLPGDCAERLDMAEVLGHQHDRHHQFDEREPLGSRPAAILAPLSQMPAAWEALDLPADKKIIVQCLKGGRSHQGLLCKHQVLLAMKWGVKPDCVTGLSRSP